jgi:hypothetical protein
MPQSIFNGQDWQEIYSPEEIAQQQADEAKRRSYANVRVNQQITVDNVNQIYQQLLQSGMPPDMAEAAIYDGGFRQGQQIRPNSEGAFEFNGMPSKDSFVDNLAKLIPYAGGALIGLGGAGLIGAGAGGAAAGGAAGDAAIAGGAGTDALGSLGSGLSTQGSAASIGGGELGTGLASAGAPTAIGDGALGAGLTTAGATSGSLAPGAFASESLYPVVGGATAAGAASAGGGSGADSLGSVFSGGLGSDLLRGIPGVLGALASNNQANNYRDLAEKYMSFGEPSRARYEASYQPGFTMANDPGYSDALGQTTKEFLHKASITGNPADSPNAWMQTLSDVNSKFAFPALQEYRRQNAGSGGLASLTAAAPGMDSASVNANANVYNSLGGAAADIFTPRKSLSDLLKDARY